MQLNKLEYKICHSYTDRKFLKNQVSKQISFHFEVEVFDLL